MNPASFTLSRSGGAYAVQVDGVTLSQAQAILALIDIQVTTAPEPAPAPAPEPAPAPQPAPAPAPEPAPAPAPEPAPRVDMAELVSLARKAAAKDRQAVLDLVSALGVRTVTAVPAERVAEAAAALTKIANS